MTGENRRFNHIRKFDFITWFWFYPYLEFQIKSGMDIGRLLVGHLELMSLKNNANVKNIVSQIVIQKIKFVVSFEKQL